IARPYGFQGEVWSTDGTEHGTREILGDYELVPNGVWGEAMLFGDWLTFFAKDDNGDYFLWRTDGSGPGTAPVRSNTCRTLRVQDPWDEPRYMRDGQLFVGAACYSPS